MPPRQYGLTPFLYPKSSAALTRLVLSILCVGNAELTSAQEVKMSALPEVTVTAQKLPEDIQVSSLSATPVSRVTLENSGARTYEDVAIYSPSLYFTDFAPRKNSSPRVRGIGGSPINPGVTTYIDGVPQLNSNSSLQELAGVDSVEFVRGPQSALFGRNTVGGLISLQSALPSSTWTGKLDGQYGNYNFKDIRGGISGPIMKDALSFSLDGGYSERDGYTKNVNTGNPIDNRSAWFGKGQLLYDPAPDWTLRFILSGERDRDGDYPLADLNALRANPHTANLRYEGYANRDIVSPTLQLTHEGSAVDFSATTAGVWWKTLDSTDIDYVNFVKNFGIPFGLNHYNKEEDFQFTEELRLGSAKDTPIKLANNVDLKWQSGLLFFTQNYEQNTGETIFFNNRKAELEDLGIGGYAQATFTFFEKLDVFGGARLDYEDKSADDKYSGFGGGSAIGNQDFLEASPQIGVSYKLLPKQTVYATLTRGYKAGGFNNGSATTLASASTPFGKEHSLNYEVGYKGSFVEDKLQVRAAAFYIDWSALQLNHIGLGGQNFIVNAGGADSKGFELELSSHPAEWLELFGAFGYDNAHYHSDATDSGAGIGGKRIQYTPDFTLSGGVEFSYQVCSSVRAYVRAEAVRYGGFAYDPSNNAGLDAYTIANFRAGISGKNWYAEGFIRNAFDAEYVPIAISYASLGAPSGYVGESGAPMTFGVKAGIKF